MPGKRTAGSSLDLPPDLREALTDLREKAEAALAENLIPFWADNTWDEIYGGFLTRLDRRGRRLDASEKVLMMQVRMIYSLAAAHRHGLRDQGYLERADRGFQYLIDTFWDHNEGGFYFSVDRKGSPLSRRKNTDFHAYAMTALSEYYQASGRPEALDWASRVFDVIMTKAADRGMGFIEDFDGTDWPALNAEQMNLSKRTGIKTIDMHANVLEGMIYLATASGDEKHKKALYELLDLICAKGIHPGYECTVTAFDADWQPMADARGRMTTSYGLNVELAWFIWEAAALLHAPSEPYHHTALGLVDHALAYGFDRERGGLAAFGPLRGNVLDAEDLGSDRLLKSWWAQAEMLNALCCAFRHTQDPAYFEALVKTFDWIYRYQIDHECGDWYQDLHGDTAEPITTDKGREFKTAFHAARALIRTIEFVSTT